MHAGDVEKQTLTTIENINSLFSRENQEKLGLDFDISKIQFSHLRVYVKHQEDIPAVEQDLRSRAELQILPFPGIGCLPRGPAG